VGKESLSMLKAVTSFLRPLLTGPTTIFSPIRPPICRTSKANAVTFIALPVEGARNVITNISAEVIETFTTILELLPEAYGVTNTA